MSSGLERQYVAIWQLWGERTRLIANVLCKWPKDPVHRSDLVPDTLTMTLIFGTGRYCKGLEVKWVNPHARLTKRLSGSRQSRHGLPYG